MAGRDLVDNRVDGAHTGDLNSSLNCVSLCAVLTRECHTWVGLTEGPDIILSPQQALCQRLHREAFWLERDRCAGDDTKWLSGVSCSLLGLLLLLLAWEVMLEKMAGSATKVGDPLTPPPPAEIWRGLGAALLSFRALGGAGCLKSSCYSFPA